MRRRLLFALAVVALGLPAAAAAKGPSEARVDGPGLKGAIVLKGNGESSGSKLGELAQASGFFPGVFVTAPDPMVGKRPEGDLGPKYQVAYTIPGPNGKSTLRQDLYPYAKPYPVSYVRPGQTFWAGQKTHGGWFLAGNDLKTMLVTAGLPARRPVASDGGGDFPALPVLAAGLALVLLAALAAASRRKAVTIGSWIRRRSTSTT